MGKLPGKGFKVKIVGEYYARSKAIGGERIISFYEFEAVIPSLTCALSVVKNKLLTPILKKKHEDYIMYRTYHITQITPLDEKSRHQMRKVEVEYMDRLSLVDYITENVLPVESRLYPDLFKLRIAVREAKDDVKGYLKKLELRKTDLEMDVEIASLNPGMNDQPETPASVSMANVSTKETAPEGVDKPDLTPAGMAVKTTERVEGLRQSMIQTGEHGDSVKDQVDDI